MIKLKWERYQRRPGVWVRLHSDHWNSLIRDTIETSIEQQLEEISAWCNETGCGRRMAYDMFRFKNKAELATFLLKWS
jgi:hypothetical protein